MSGSPQKICNRFEDLLCELVELDGEGGGLAEGEREEWLRHAASCKRCGGTLAGYRRTVELLRSLPRQTAPAGFLEWVGEQIRREPARGGRTARVVLWLRFRPARFLAAAALGLVGLGALLWALLGGPSSTPVELASNSRLELGERDLVDAEESPDRLVRSPTAETARVPRKQERQRPAELAAESAKGARANGLQGEAGGGGQDRRERPASGEEGLAGVEAEESDGAVPAAPRKFRLAPGSVGASRTGEAIAPASAPPDITRTPPGEGEAKGAEAGNFARTEPTPTEPIPPSVSASLGLDSGVTLVLVTPQPSPGTRRTLEQELAERFPDLRRDSAGEEARRKAPGTSSSSPQADKASKELPADDTRDQKKAGSRSRGVAPIAPAPEPASREVEREAEREEDGIEPAEPTAARTLGEKPARVAGENPAVPGHPVPALEELTIHVAARDLDELLDYLSEWVRRRGGKLQPALATSRRGRPASEETPLADAVGTELRGASPDASLGVARGEDAGREEPLDAPETAEDSPDTSRRVTVRIVFERIADRGE